MTPEAFRRGASALCRYGCSTPHNSCEGLRRRRGTLSILGPPLALDGVCARGAVLDPADVERGAFEVELIPTKVADLDRRELVPGSEEDHRTGLKVHRA
jgi:hypothetical protein